MKINLEYIWLGGNNEFRSKNRIIKLEKEELLLEDIPEWNFDGSSTNQAFTEDTEILLKPVKFVKSPFILENCKSYLVLCETYHNDNMPNFNNYRHNAKQTFDMALECKPWFGLEQEYIIIGDSILNDKKNQGQYYCGIGKGKYPLERKIVLEHLDACLYAELEISGTNAEVAHCQWEYQIGPCVGIDAGDQLLLSRYILERIAEKYSVSINYDPKPFPKINGSGCHVNFSTEPMRQEGGISIIHDAIEKLSNNHQDIISVSGENNEMRLTGHHETSSMDVFSWGVGTRHTSVRIPNSVIKDGKGYFEDRRCAANINPYLVTSAIFKICCIDY
jgi:glutamine synthetase